MAPSDHVPYRRTISEDLRMTKLFMITALSLCLLTVSAHATTAVLCGDPELVDENNDRADVWLIFESGSPYLGDYSAVFLGREATVVSTSVKNGQFSIQTQKPSHTVTLSEADIDSSVCDGERLFPVQLESPSALESFGNCRCFED